MTKVLVITGSRKGIGRYLAEYYLSKGYAVIGCSRSESDLKHNNYQHYCLDVADETAVKKMVFTIVREHKRIDFLINNAGVASMNHSMLTPLSSVETTFSTNVFGTFIFCREVGKVMTRNHSGKIVNFSTVAVPLNLDGEAVYSASKAAVEQLTRVLAKELGPSGVTCNAIGPSPIPTDLIANVSEEKISALMKKQSVQRYGTYEDVSNVIDFFFSDNSSFINGQIIYLGGIN